jgi:hypothetical protein
MIRVGAVRPALPANRPAVAPGPGEDPHQRRPSEQRLYVARPCFSASCARRCWRAHPAAVPRAGDRQRVRCPVESSATPGALAQRISARQVPPSSITAAGVRQVPGRSRRSTSSARPTPSNQVISARPAAPKTGDLARQRSCQRSAMAQISARILCLPWAILWSPVLRRRIGVVIDGGENSGPKTEIRHFRACHQP